MARDAAVVVMWAVFSSPLLLGTCLIEMRRSLIVFHNPSQASPSQLSYPDSLFVQTFSLGRCPRLLRLARLSGRARMLNRLFSNVPLNHELMDCKSDGRHCNTDAHSSPRHRHQSGSSPYQPAALTGRRVETTSRNAGLRTSLKPSPLTLFPLQKQTQRRSFNIEALFLPQAVVPSPLTGWKRTRYQENSCIRAECADCSLCGRWRAAVPEMVA
ncbi:hypothetical protein BKA56DRAFT_121437 [Ilyonectria sp. MPI-CAGE-AT-0026]|nr:hypothetical protein BKA56DRAFT_121437 [Ilyonectria sp. MPI-CAGE-AT-0026]